MYLEYDGTYDGFLSAVFRAYEKKISKTACFSAGGGAAQSFLTESERVETDVQRADRVGEKLRALRIERECFLAWLSREYEIDGAVFAYIRIAIEKNGRPGGGYGSDTVRRVDMAANRVSGSVHRYLQFVRFVSAGRPQTPGALVPRGGERPSLYAADIEPEYDILELLANHFTKRFASGRFIIRDISRKKALVWNGREWHISKLPELFVPELPRDGAFEELWRDYFDAVAIPWRKNKKLQAKFVPAKFRQHMTEFRPGNQPRE